MSAPASPTPHPTRVTRPKAWIALIGFYLLVALLGGWLIYQSWDITTLDQGDYTRAISPLLSGPIPAGEYRHWEKPTLLWQFRSPIAWSQIDNSASLYFALQAQFQALWSATFSLTILGLISKILVLALLVMVAKRIAEQLQWGLLGKSAIWVMLALIFFMSHHIYLLNSFYQEHVFWVGLPIIIAGVLDSIRWRSTGLIIIGAALCGAAKTQFFYVPTVLLTLLFLWNRWHHNPQNRILITGLVIAQGISALPLLHNPYRALNFYHATYYGSYVLAAPQTQAQLLIPAQTLRCIGSDRWGMVLKGEHGDQLGPTIDSCFDQVQLGTRDVLYPYYLEPSLLWKMWRFAKPALWSAKPFHNLPTFPYIVTPAGMDPQGLPYPFPPDQVLLKWSDLRELYITQRVEHISVFALCLAIFLTYRRWLGLLPLGLFFFTSLLWSQIAIALIGEGFRDLGKHFAAAQLSLDCLVILLIICLSALLQKAWQALTRKSKIVAR